MKTKNYFVIIIFLFSVALLGSCQYKNILTPVLPPLPPTDTISFTTQIEPVFNNSNNCTVCHNTGGQVPDLSTGNAYNSIMSMSLVNLETPESSLIYWYPDPEDTSKHTWKKYTPVQAQLVLQWIKQGALDN